MKRFIHILLVCVCGMVGDSSLLYAGNFYSNSNVECYVDTEGNDWFWFCGKQSQSCRGNSVAKWNEVTWLYHGQKFNWTKRGGKGNYWCCGGTSSGSGRFYQGENWITKSETITETLPTGKCTWVRKTNICGQVDNPGDKCTEATGECTTGFVSHNGKCVAACPEGQAFASSTSSACVACEPSITQGVKKNVCVKCESNQFFDNNTLSCVARSSKLQVSSNAFNACWMCVTPGAMYNCLKTISNNGSLDSNAELAAACSVTSKDKDATKFKLPEKTFKLKLLPLDLKLKAVKANPAALNLNKNVMTTTEKLIDTTMGTRNF